MKIDNYTLSYNENNENIEDATKTLGVLIVAGFVVYVFVFSCHVTKKCWDKYQINQIQKEEFPPPYDEISELTKN